ncbi:hypothetical protein TIFTF001_054477, partial [Ficus carica]
IAPDWRQALSLKKTVEDRIAKDGVIGIGITATAVGLIAGDLFIKQAKQYAENRPDYPKELFEFIASKTPLHGLVWDVGTGSGQAAQSIEFSVSE